MNLLSVVRRALIDDVEPVPTLVEIDQRLATLHEDAKRVADHRHALEDETDELRAAVDRHAFASFKNDPLATAAIATAEARLQDLERLFVRADAAAADVARQQQALRAERVQVGEQLQADELREALAVLEMAGRVAHEALTKAQQAVGAFMAADQVATRLGVQLRIARKVDQQTDPDRFLGERLQDCLAHYFYEAITASRTTALDLSVTRAKDHVDFLQASRRSFSALVGEKNNVA